MTDQVAKLPEISPELVFLFCFVLGHELVFFKASYIKRSFFFLFAHTLVFLIQDDHHLINGSR